MSDPHNVPDSFTLGSATGDQPENIYKFIVVPFGKYEVTVKLKPTNEFVSITEIQINKDFLSESQRQAQKGFLDVDDFYKE